MDNLVLVCGFHHKLVHELGWSLSRNSDSTMNWTRPNGIPYVPGPAPPEERSMSPPYPPLEAESSNGMLSAASTA